LKRLATAMVALAVFLVANRQLWTLAGFLVLCVIAAALEFGGLCGRPGLDGPVRRLWFAPLVAGVLAVAATGAWALLAPLALLGALCVAGWNQPARALRSCCLVVVGAIWLGILPGSALALRQAPAGELLMIWLVAAVVAGDAAAFYVGSAIGRHPLAPTVSPRKTVEGALAGLLAAAASGPAMAWWLEPAPSRARLALTGLCLGGAGILGDLFESLVKRAAGVKDSGSWLPGHGGILDRIDAALFAAPALALLHGWTLAQP
jgi:phosphatidate cytidylyltransferase